METSKFEIINFEVSFENFVINLKKIRSCWENSEINLESYQFDK